MKYKSRTPVRSTNADLALLLICLFLFISCSSGSSKFSTGTTFSCPNCGGIQVDDCLDCNGYRNVDVSHNMCIDRRLFQPHNTDTTDHEDHYHFLWNDLVGALVWFVTAGVATACGVGGGGIYVPLGILLLQFAPKPASGLSQVSIFGASLGGLFLNARDCHPSHNTKIRDHPGFPEDDHDGPQPRAVQKSITAEEEQQYLQEGRSFYKRPLINYDMALFLAPMEMAGAVLGVLVQRILPNWLYLLIAGLVLSFTSYKTYRKFFDTRKKEKEQETLAARRQQEEDGEREGEPQQQQEEAAPGDEKGVNESPAAEKDSPEGQGMEAAQQMTTAMESTSQVRDEDEKQVERPPSPENDSDEEKAVPTQEDISDSSGIVDDKDALALRQMYLKEDMRQYPREKLTALVILWAGLILLTLMKGGKGVESLVGIDCESPWYAVLIVLQFLWLFGFAVYFGIQLVRKQAARVAVDYPYLPDDPVWDRRALRFYGCFTFIAGVVAGLIGIGGGMVLGPLMLVMGIHPRVSSATTATMVVLTSSSVAVIFVTSGLVPWSYAVFFFFVCLCGAYIGKSKIDSYVKRTGRASLLIFILATIIAFATVGCFVIMLTRLADKDWCLDGFNKFCNVDTKESCPATRMLDAMFQGSSYSNVKYSGYA